MKYKFEIERLEFERGAVCYCVRERQYWLGFIKVYDHRYRAHWSLDDALLQKDFLESLTDSIKSIKVVE